MVKKQLPLLAKIESNKFRELANTLKVQTAQTPLVATYLPLALRYG